MSRVTDMLGCRLPVVLLLGLLPCFVACGGSVAKNDAPAGATGGSAPTAEPDASEVLDDVDHADSPYPALPPDSSAFFWRGGLGNWFVTTAEGNTADAPVDETATEAGDDAGKAYHVSGEGQGVGIDLWAQLDHPSGRPMDMSAYSGIGFRARLIGDAATLVVAFGLNGQYFASAAAPPGVAFPVSGQWQTLTVPFTRVPDLDTSAITSLDFIVTSGGAPFTFWVDDLALLCRGKCP